MQLAILVKNLIYLVSILANLGLGFFVFFYDRQNKINRIFFSLILGICGWLISLFWFYTAKEPQWVLWLGRINFAVALPIFYFLLEFAIVFPREIITIPKNIKTVLRWWVFLFAILVFLTPFVSREEIIKGPGERETIYGFLFPLYVFHYIAFSVSAIAILIHKIRKIGAEVEKNQIRYVIIGLSLGLIFVFVTNVLLYSLGISWTANLGPLGIVIFSGFITAAILRYHLFGIRVILVEILVVVIALLLFLQIFVAGPFWLKVLNGSVFVLFCIFGYFLIKAILREIGIRKEAEKLSQAKSEFISMASHQLRTPLSAIKGYISMMIEGSYGQLPEKVKEKMAHVFYSNERLIRVVNDLLNISKIELGKMELEKAPARIEDLIQSGYEEMEIEAEKKNLKFIWEKPKTLLPKINVDELKIRQVILNLIDNAIRYTKKGEIEIKAQKTNSTIQISVKDSGEGLTQEEKSKIFEGFTRGSAGIAYFIEGAGLGLYVAKKFLELHQGKIWVESPGKGKGSTFYIELPIE